MKISESLKDFINSEEGEKYMEEFALSLKRKQDRKENNIKRIKKMYNDEKTFNILVESIINKHNDEYVDKCYKNGYMPHPMNILYSLFDLSEIEGDKIEPFDDFTINFSSSVFEFFNWQFAITHGQGSVCSVYYNKKLKYRD